MGRKPTVRFWSECALEITGIVEGDRLTLIWLETGGPQVDKDLELSSFGSKMISKIVATDLDGLINYDWQASGLVATVWARMDMLAR